MLDILVPILYYLNDARADQCKSQPAVIRLLSSCYTSSMHFLLLLMGFILGCSPRWTHAHRRVHSAAAERGEKLWRAPE